jgi:hypothetical protein
MSIGKLYSLWRITGGRGDNCRMLCNARGRRVRRRQHCIGHAQGRLPLFQLQSKSFRDRRAWQWNSGIVIWGLGGLGSLSQRTVIAQFHDGLVGKPAKNVKEVAERWTDHVWAQYSPLLQTCQGLNTKKPHDPTGNPPDPMARTKAEEEEFEQLKRGLVLGFFIGGYVFPSRIPEAFSINFDPLVGKPTPLQFPAWNFSGAPNMIKRLVFGSDDELRKDILASGKWSGTPQDLDALLAQHQLSTALLPIRDAIDFVHACISSTIKAMKFSSLAQVCGGPIEIAVITTDRPFRWVRHKEWDAAITEGTP